MKKFCCALFFLSLFSISHAETPDKVAQPADPTPNAKKFLKRGELLYRGGDLEKRIPACIICHGPKGLGNAKAGIPMLAGQQSTYIIQALRAFKEKTRQSDLSGPMQMLTDRMSPDDMEAVANYIQNLH